MARVEGVSLRRQVETDSDSIETRELRFVSDLTRGDSSSLEWFLNLYSQEIYHFAYRFMGHPEDARDAAQQSLMKAFQQAGKFNPKKGRFRSWLLKITANHCLNELNRRARLRSRESRLEDESPGVAYSAEDRPSLTEESLAVREALGELASEDRQIVILAYYHGLTYREIGKTLNLRLGTVKSRLSRAIDRLRTYFAEENNRS